MPEKEDIDSLKNEIVNLKERISELEGLNMAMESVLEMYRNEMIMADKTIKAYQAIEDLSRNEKIEKDVLIKAHEALDKLFHTENEK